MKKRLLSFVFFLTVIAISAQSQQKILIISEPVFMTPGNGGFTVSSSTSVYIIINGGDSITKIAKDFSDKFYQSSGVKLNIKNKIIPGTRNLVQFQKAGNRAIGSGGYELPVSSLY